MNLEPIAITDLDHRAYYLRGSQNNPSYMAASQDGYVAVLDETFKVVNHLRFESEIKDISLDSSQRRISVVDSKSGNLFVGDLDGKVIFKDQKYQRFEACFFQAKAGLMWGIQRISGEEVECYVFDTLNWNVIANLSINDDFIDSSFSFHEVPDNHGVSLWMAAGQDGQKIFWLKLNQGKIECQEESLLEDTIPPAFNDAGNEFLVSDDQKLYRYSYPSVQLLDSYSYPDDTYIGYSLCYIGKDQALISMGDGRIFKINTEKMMMVEEVIVKGHEPKAAEYYYPSLKGDPEICTDISGFYRYGNKIIAVYRRDYNPSLKIWKDSLLFFDIMDILQESTG
jgi:hypothetical protein